MKIRASKPALVVVILLVLLTTFFIQSRSSDLALYARMHAAVGDYELYDAELTRDVVSARSGLLPNYDPLGADRRHIMATFDSLAKASSAGSNAAEAGLRGPVELLAQAQSEKLAAVEHFESANALLRNSLLYLTFAGPALQIPREQPQVSDESRQLSYAVLRFVNALDSDVAAEITRILDRLSLVPPDGTDLGTLVTQARLIVDLAPKTDMLLRQIVAVPTSDRIQNLRAAVLKESEFVERRAQVFRVLLYFVALMLLSYVAVQFVRLKTGADELYRTNSYLQLEMSERIRLSETARRQELQLIQKNRMVVLGMMVSGVAHEINNPNHLILMNSHLLATTCKDLLALVDAGKPVSSTTRVGGLEYAEMRTQIPLLANDIHEAAARVGQIVDELKYFFRPSSSASSDTFDVNGAAKRAIRLLSHLIRAKTERFTTRFGSDLPLAAGSAQHFEQVAVNLLVNALEALPNASCGVDVSTIYDRIRDKLLFIVDDQGVGISQDDLARIRDPFFTTKASTGGTGLGLAITSTLLSDLGGSLEFTSEIGKGTRAVIGLRRSDSVASGGTDDGGNELRETAGSAGG